MLSDSKHGEKVLKGNGSSNGKPYQYHYIDVFSCKDLSQTDLTVAEAITELHKQARTVDTPLQEDICKVVPMPWYEELIVFMFWLFFFAALLYGPFVLLYLAIYHRKVALYSSIIIFTLSLLTPSAFMPSACSHYLSTLLLKYHSYRAAWTSSLPTDRPCIIVSPPHGLFPFGALLALLSFPRTSKRYVRGLAATALLNFPFIGHLLKKCGVIDASRSSVQKHLSSFAPPPLDSSPKSITIDVGISSGGIAEIYETKTWWKDNSHSECIILRRRGGIAKLALETGSYLVPSYHFNNLNGCLSVWYDRFGVLETVSRFLRVSIVFFWGRFGLPVPYRVPLFAVLGDPIPVPLVPNPTKDQIVDYLGKTNANHVFICFWVFLICCL